MSEKEFLKQKDMLLNSIEKNTSEHWKNYYKDVPIECIYDDLVIDINEIKRLTEENQELKSKIKTYEEPEDLTLMFMYCDEKAKDKIKELKDRIDKALEKIQLLIDIGFDYDGFNKTDSLKTLIDELVNFARDSRAILKGDKQ